MPFFIAVFLLISLSLESEASVSRRGFLTTAGLAIGSTFLPCEKLLAATSVSLESSPITEDIWLQLFRFIPYRVVLAPPSPEAAKLPSYNRLPIAKQLARSSLSDEQKTKFVEDYLRRRRDEIDRQISFVPAQLAEQMNLNVEDVRREVEYFWSVSSRYGSLDVYARLDGQDELLNEYILAVKRIEPNIVAPLQDVEEWFKTVNDMGLGWRDRYVYEAYAKIGFQRAGPQARAAIERFEKILALPTRELREMAEHQPRLFENGTEEEKERYLEMLRARYAFEDERAKSPPKSKMTRGHSDILSTTGQLVNSARKAIVSGETVSTAPISKVVQTQILQLTYQPETASVGLPQNLESPELVNTPEVSIKNSSDQ